MQRVPAVDPVTATGETRTMPAGAEATLGGSANMVRTMANSPVARDGYVGLHAALSAGTLDPLLRAHIALVVAETNASPYCLAAHTAAAKALGLDEEQMRAARKGASPDPKIAAALQFVRTVVEYRADITDRELNRVREAGYSNGATAEMLANVVLNIYGNYFNSIAETEIDVALLQILIALGGLERST